MTDTNKVVDVQEDKDTQNQNLSYVYQELTKNDNGNYNIVSMVAYIIYKERKIEFFQKYNGSPTDQQLQAFHEINMMPACIQGYRDQAELVVKRLLNLSLERKIVEIETKYKTVTEANMTSSMEKLNNSVNAKHVLVKSDIESVNHTMMTNYVKLDSKLDKFVNRGFWGWVFEIGRGAIITLVSSLILWFVLVSLQGRKVQGDLENSHLPNVSPPGLTATPTSTKP